MVFSKYAQYALRVLFVMILFIAGSQTTHRVTRPRYFNTGSGCHFLPRTT